MGATESPSMDERRVFVRHCNSCDMDIELCYHTFGHPSNPAVLLVGGLNMQSYAWDEMFCDQLTQQQFFVVRFDNRDIGFSTKIEDPRVQKIVPWRLFLPEWMACGERLPYSLKDMALDALALMDVLGIQVAHVVGISMGGMISQLMALLAPQRVRTLTCIMSSTNARDLPHPAWWVKLWMLRKPPSNTDGEQLVEFRMKALQGLLYGCVPVDESYLKKRIALSLNRSAYTEGLLRQAAAIMRTPPRDEALRGSVSCPALVIHGQNDVLCRVEHGYRLARVLRNAKFAVFKNMGHYLNPAYFDTIVEEFVSLVDRANALDAALEVRERLHRQRLNVVSGRYEDFV